MVIDLTSVVLSALVPIEISADAVVLKPLIATVSAFESIVILVFRITAHEVLVILLVVISFCEHIIDKQMRENLQCRITFELLIVDDRAEVTGVLISTFQVIHDSEVLIEQIQVS